MKRRKKKNQKKDQVFEIRAFDGAQNYIPIVKDVESLDQAIKMTVKGYRYLVKTLKEKEDKYITHFHIFVQDGDPSRFAESHKYFKKYTNLTYCFVDREDGNAQNFLVCMGTDGAIVIEITVPAYAVTDEEYWADGSILDKMIDHAGSRTL